MTLVMILIHKTALNHTGMMVSSVRITTEVYLVVSRNCITVHNEEWGYQPELRSGYIPDSTMVHSKMIFHLEN